MDKKRITHEYKVIRSSWGVRIVITATVSISEARDANNSSVELIFTGSAADLPANYKDELASGLARCEAAILEQSSGSRRVVVDVERVAFIESDFQVDGLSVAMCRWAEAAFSLPFRKIDETFDRKANAYNFEWG
jgi:hypothetical protein